MRVVRIGGLLALAGILLGAHQNGSAQSPSQRELNGFVIGQHRDALKEAFGEPYEERKTDDGWVYLIYLLREKPFAYMTFKFPSNDLNHFISVQIAGDGSTPMAPFVGVRLGASADEVKRKIGRPSKTQRLADPPVEVWKYEKRNYSFEFDAGKKLVSIQIFGLDGFADLPDWSKPIPWNDLQTRLRSTDLDSLMTTFSPDAEIYQASELFWIDNSMRKVLSDPKSLFRRGLALAVTALQHELAREPAEINARMMLGIGRMGAVYKFPEGAPVKEIVLLPQAGEWRVWEVKLR
jgi:hypothetical protein